MLEPVSGGDAGLGCTFIRTNVVGNHQIQACGAVVPVSGVDMPNWYLLTSLCLSR